MTDKKVRADHMSNAQATAMKVHGRKFRDKTRSHQNCFEATGVARPGKTRSDKAQGSWKSKQQRNASHAARREALNGKKK